MAKIAVLPPQVANMIAAGEVVERPASVVKELMENAIDAGARAVTVEIRNGGVTYLRVTDDGCGMEPEDARTAFLRHATSKIRGQADLDAIGTLGFRGEALAAIAAVSRVDLFTKTAHSPLGTHLVLEGGQVLEEEETGCPDGTTILIKDLFFNTPARMKFLKKDSTEASYVEASVELVALAHPELAVKFIKDGKEGLYTPGDGSMFSVIYAIYGKDFTRELTALSGSQRDVQVGGYVTRPTYSRANRSMQNFFVNGRFIRSKLLSAAVEQAYHGRLTGGRYPACFLDLRVNTGAVDVNVHPAKLEVKFSHEREVFSAVYQFITAALDGLDPVAPAAREEEEATPAARPSTGEYQPVQAARPAYRTKAFTFPEQAAPVSLAQESLAPYQTKSAPGRVEAEQPAAPVSPPAAVPDRPTAAPRSWARGIEVEITPEESLEMESVITGAPPAPTSPAPTSPAPTPQAPEKAATEQGKASAPSAPGGAVPDFRVIGEVFATYLLVQVEENLVMIDKHAAHERMIYNKLRDQAGGTAGQTLLAPETVTLSRPEKNALLEQSSQLEQAGFQVEDFGEGAVIVRQVPMYLRPEDIGFVLSDIADKLLQGKKAQAEAYDDIVKSVACKAAVKAGTFTDESERKGFVAAILADPQVRSCPHGRPVLFSMSRAEIEKCFKRIV